MESGGGSECGGSPGRPGEIDKARGLGAEAAALGLRRTDRDRGPPGLDRPGELEGPPSRCLRGGDYRTFEPRVRAPLGEHRAFFIGLLGRSAGRPRSGMRPLILELALRCADTEEAWHLNVPDRPVPVGVETGEQSCSRCRTGRKGTRRRSGEPPRA
ncbi:hypothetical protein NDU88_003203 [Pleurodeles waltl]|uniref:Uncharacterized protein n=1 Tax=Pleurodeles waltl TaxID=8319 RepID=A0AAV7RHX0_PLEWA|nr:hypothetical protein NDU88_003203 [Pleurodeles waltl]